MALVNTPPIRPPEKWLNDPELGRHVEELYFVIFQLFQRTGGGNDIININNEQIIDNTTNISIAETGWPEATYSLDDFQGAFRESVQSTNYTTTGNEIIKLDRDVIITLNPTPNDKERVYVKSATGKGFTAFSGKGIDGRNRIKYRKGLYR